MAMKHTNTKPVDQMKYFITSWYNPGEMIRMSVFGKSKAYGTITYEEFLSMTEDELAEQVMDTNVYVNAYPIKKDLGVSEKVRGGKSNVGTLRGLFIDLDLGKGYDTQDELFALMIDLPFEPTMVVDSGSGGLHIWYRFTRDLPPEEDEILEMWGAMVQHAAGDVAIDKVFESARMLRLPGTFRNKNGAETPVRLLYTSDARIDPDEVIRLSKPYYTAKQRRVADYRTLEDNKRTVYKSQMSENGTSEVDLDDWANDHYWDEILVGWTKYGSPSKDGTQQWTRPDPEGNATPRSATTDWDESPNALALHSLSEETRLVDLHEMGVPLTKFRCMLRLVYNDDMMAMMKDYMRDRINERQR